MAALYKMSYAIAPNTGEDPVAFRELLQKVSAEHPKGAEIYYCPVVCTGTKE